MIIEAVTCDSCNIDMKVTMGNETRGLFFGTFKDASDWGWESGDQGHRCPLCIEEEAALDAGGESFSSMEDLVDTILHGKL